MRYLGSKVKLLSAIEEVIDTHNIEGESFADLFAGTGCVGDYFKDKYQIISNDFLYYSYVLNNAKLLNDRIPKFDRVQEEIGFQKYYILNYHMEWIG